MANLGSTIGSFGSAVRSFGSIVGTAASLVPTFANTINNTFGHLASWATPTPFSGMPSQNIPYAQYAQSTPTPNLGDLGNMIEHLFSWGQGEVPSDLPTPPIQPQQSNQPPQPQVIVPPTAGGYYPYRRY